MYQESRCVVCTAVTSFTSLAWTSGLSRRLPAPSAREIAKQAVAPECPTSIVFELSNVSNVAGHMQTCLRSLFFRAGGVMLLIQHAAV